MTTDRDELEAALPESLGPVLLRRPSPPFVADGRPEPRGYGDLLLDALLPVVEEIAARKTAETLTKLAGLIEKRAASEQGDSAAAFSEVAQYVRACVPADALDPT